MVEALLKPEVFKDHLCKKTQRMKLQKTLFFNSLTLKKRCIP